MALAFSLTATAVVSIVIECILYGLSLALFGITVFALFYKRCTRNLNYLMFIATMLLFILSTMHVVADAQRVYRGFVVAEVPEVYFGDNTKLTWKNSINGIETFLADAVLIYRCYIVWSRRSWIVIPLIIGWCGVVVAGVHTIWSIAQPATNPNDIFVIQTGRWVVSFYSLTLATNVVATSLLAYKLWSTNQRVSKTRSHPSTLHPIMMTIIECGALYAVTLVVLLATYETRSNGAYVVTDIIGQVIPITFYLVITRAAMIRMATSNETHIQLSEPRFVRRSATATGPSDATSAMLSKPVEVHIAQFVDHDDKSVEQPFGEEPHSNA